MNTLNTKLTNSPYVFQVTSRLEQLNQYYSKAQVEACLLMRLSGMESRQSKIALHIDNILLSYDNETIKDALDIMNYSNFTRKAV